MRGGKKEMRGGGTFFGGSSSAPTRVNTDSGLPLSSLLSSIFSVLGV